MACSPASAWSLDPAPRPGTAGRALARPVVAVTGLRADDNPAPGVAVARALRADPDFRGSVVGLAHDALEPGLYLEGLLDAAFLLPYPSAGREALGARLAALQADVGLDVLLPTLDHELPALVALAPALAAAGTATLLPGADQLAAVSKARLAELGPALAAAAAARGAPESAVVVPRSAVLSDAAGLPAVHAALGADLVVKGPRHGARVCQGLDAAVAAFHALAARWGLPVVVQEWVAGDEVNVCALGDGAGGLVGAVAMRKLVVTAAGKGWAGVTIAAPELLTMAADFMAATRWRGPCELEARRARDGRLHLLELNPRFPAWADLTAGVGQNLPAAAVALAQGGPLPALGAYRPGVAFVRIALDQIVDIGALEAITTQGAAWPAPAGGRP